MPSTQPSRRRILRRQTYGFLTLIGLTWINEVFYLPHRLFGEPPEFNWTRVLVRTAVMLCIWGWVHLTTKPLLRRLHQLEEFLRICSWCRKVGHGDHWLSLEDYFGSHFSTRTSHGICPDCVRRISQPVPQPPDPAGPQK